MKYVLSLIILFFALTSFSQNQSKQWYAWSFTSENGMAKTSQISFLDLSSLGQVAHAKETFPGKFTFTKTTDTETQSTIGYLKLADKETGLFMTSPNHAVSQLDVQPGTEHLSFVIRSSNDVLCIKKSGDYELLLSAERIVSYAWINTFRLAVVISTEEEEQRCVLLNIRDMEQTEVSKRVGNTVKRIDDGAFAFIDIFSDDYRYIKSYDMQTKQSEIIVRLPSTLTFFESPDGERYYIGDGSEIKQFVRYRDADWKTFVDLKNYGIENITELCAGRKSSFLLCDEN